MADCYDRPPISITPCEFESANEDCPIGYINTSCITYNGDDEVISGVLNNESLNILSITIRKLVYLAAIVCTIKAIYSSILSCLRD